MRLHALAPVLLSAASLAPSLARAEDATPAEAGRRALAGLAAPSEEHAYSVDVELYVGRARRLGDGTIAAAPETVEGKALWRTTETVRMGRGAAPQMLGTNSGLHGADLRIVEETVEMRGMGETTLTRAVRTEKGLHVTRTKDEAVEERDVLAEAGTVSSGLATLVLFLRQVPAEPAEYEVTVWDGHKRSVTKQRLSMRGVGRLKNDLLGLDVEALWAVGTGGMEVYLDAKDRSFLASKSQEKGMWLTKKGLVAPRQTEAAPDLSKHAASAKGVCAKFALGLLTGNLAAIDASFHWPSLTADAQAKGGDIDEATLRSLTLASLKGTMQRFDAETAWGVVNGALDGATERPAEDGAVRVTLGPPIEKVSYTARQIEGSGWLITAMETHVARTEK